MKPLFAILVAVTLSAQYAFADWVIVQKSTADGKTQDISIKVKGDKARADVGDQLSMIIDSSTSGMVMLMHAQKIAMKMDAAAVKAAMALASGALGGLSKEPLAKPVATGQKEKVGEYETEIYTWSGPIGSGKFWVAKDFPNAKEINAMQDKMMQAMGDPTATMTPSASDFPGMVVKSEMTIQGKLVNSETVSAKEAPVDEAVFTLPTGYQEMKMPTLPGK